MLVFSLQNIFTWLTLIIRKELLFKSHNHSPTSVLTIGKPCRNDLCKTNDCVNFFFASVVKNGCFQHSTLTLLTKFIATSQSYPLYFSLLIKYILIKNLRDKTTLITLLRIPYLCHFGSSSFVLPIRTK